jgi:hypothetical protein
MVGLFVRYGGITRQTQFFTMDALCDRKRKLVPRCITELLMRSNRIVNLSLHTLFSKVLFELIATSTKYRKDMKNGIALTGWDDNSGVLHLVYIKVGNFLAVLVSNI